MCRHTDGSQNLSAQGPNRLPDPINLKEQATEEQKYRNANQYFCCCYSPASPEKQKPTNRVNWPAKDYLDFESREQRDSLVLAESQQWQNTLTEKGPFIRYAVDSVDVHNNTDACLNDDEVNPGRSHYPKCISCIENAYITEEMQRETDECITSYGIILTAARFIFCYCHFYYQQKIETVSSRSTCPRTDRTKMIDWTKKWAPSQFYLYFHLPHMIPL